MMYVGTNSRLLAVHIDATTHGDALHGGHHLRRKSRHRTKLVLHRLAFVCGVSVAAWAAWLP